MSYYFLDDTLYFPPVKEANNYGILAIGGDLKPERLLLAYRSGIFPWFSEGEPIIWWSPDPRFVLFPEKLKVAKSMRPIFNQKRFSITYDQAFSEVITQCRQTYRPGQHGTWITDDMQAAYQNLHQQGYAHSVEVRNAEGKLVGGLYGISLGACFFGESMFSHESNASKAGFITLVRDLQKRGIQLVDCQVHTPHLESLGAEMILREDFIDLIQKLLQVPTLQGNWQELFSTTSW